MTWEKSKTTPAMFEKAPATFKKTTANSEKQPAIFEKCPAKSKKEQTNKDKLKTEYIIAF